MMIKDLEMNKELDREALSTVRGGGIVTGTQGGQFAPNSTFGGGPFSMTLGISAPVNAPMQFLSDNDFNNVIGSVGTWIVS